MSGMDRLTDDQLQAIFDHCGGDAQAMARELLAHRRASQAAPAPSDGQREALEAAHEELCRIDCEGITETRNESDVLERVRFFASRGAAAIRAALSASPAQEGGE